MPATRPMSRKPEKTKGKYSRGNCISIRKLRAEFGPDRYRAFGTGQVAASLGSECLLQDSSVGGIFIEVDARKKVSPRPAWMTPHKTCSPERRVSRGCFPLSSRPSGFTVLSE
jgi:hypothetical protein